MVIKLEIEIEDDVEVDDDNDVGDVVNVDDNDANGVDGKVSTGKSVLCLTDFENIFSLCFRIWTE